jgi:flavorubredoxin
MHDSTRKLVDWLTDELVSRNVSVEQFNLVTADTGKLVMSLLDAATVVLGTPTMLAEPQPLVAYAAMLINALRPPTRFLSIVGSFGWGGRTVEILKRILKNVKAEFIKTLLVKGHPRDEARKAISVFASLIKSRHKSASLI